MSSLGIPCDMPGKWSLSKFAHNSLLLPSVVITFFSLPNGIVIVVELCSSCVFGTAVRSHLHVVSKRPYLIVSPALQGRGIPCQVQPLFASTVRICQQHLEPV